MGTNVEIEDDAKERLDELREEVRAKTGTEVSQQELLSRLIDDAHASRTAVVDSIESSTVPLSESEKAAMQRGRIASGTSTDESDIDDILYE